MAYRVIPGLALWVVLAVPGSTRADEIRLKDGSRISGTIVGFENGSFRVETSYGFALIQKDKVVDINITAPKKESEPKEKTSILAAPPPAPVKESLPPVNSAPPINAKLSGHPIPSAPAAPATAKVELIPPKVVIAPPAPPPVPEPLVIRDEIRGNLYVNHTFGFEMYKPPSWNLIPAARKALPDAVAALGTDDETTLLVIGRERVKDSLETHAAATEKALSEVYENYRLISTRRMTVAGLDAIERRSRGTADGRDWSIILLTFVHGDDIFTMMGMTWADSDLIQVQENVIAKTVNSLTFAPHQDPNRN